LDGCKSAFSTDNDEAMSEEAIKGDKAAIDVMKNLEDMSPPSSVQKK
jgi:hypothetical protein